MNESAQRFVRSHLGDARKFNDATAHLVWALLQAPAGMEYLEFGVGGARTLNIIASVVSPAQVFGFDCFEGLPEDWRPGYPKGTFSTGGKLPEVLPNVRLMHGLFKATLPEFEKIRPGSPIGFIHVDCDLYSSTKEVLEFCKPRLIPGSVMVFDEYLGYDGWEQHEHKALLEAGLLFDCISVNMAHEQLAIRIK